MDFFMVERIKSNLNYSVNKCATTVIKSLEYKNMAGHAKSS